MSGSMTICVECKHVILRRTKLCGASVFQDAQIDPVTGKMKAKVYQSCAKVNAGWCPKFSLQLEVQSSWRRFWEFVRVEYVQYFR